METRSAMPEKTLTMTGLSMHWIVRVQLVRKEFQGRRELMEYQALPARQDQLEQPDLKG
jgi:hypothetical protein